MYITPYFGGCKYTNNFLFINKNIVFQHFVLLITFPARPSEVTSNSPTFCLNQPISDITLPSSCHFGTDLSFRHRSVISTERSGWRNPPSRPSYRKSSDSLMDGAPNAVSKPENGTVLLYFRLFDAGRSDKRHFEDLKR